MKRLGLLLLLAAAMDAAALTSPMATAYWSYGGIPYPIIQSKDVLNVYTAVMVDDEFAPEGWGFFQIEGEKNIDTFRQALTNVNAAVTMMQRDKGIPGVTSAPIGFFSFRAWGQGGTPNAADFAALLFPPAKEEETESAVAEDGE